MSNVMLQDPIMLCTLVNSSQKVSALTQSNHKQVKEILNDIELLLFFKTWHEAEILIEPCTHLKPINDLGEKALSNSLSLASTKDKPSLKHDDVSLEAHVSLTDTSILMSLMP
jgi:hypothetical protein